MDEVVGTGESSRVGERSNPDRRYNEHLQPQYGAAGGEGMVVGPTGVAGGSEGGRAGRLTVDGPATDGH